MVGLVHVADGEWAVQKVDGLVWNRGSPESGGAGSSVPTADFLRILLEPLLARGARVFHFSYSFAPLPAQLGHQVRLNSNNIVIKIFDIGLHLVHLQTCLQIYNLLLSFLHIGYDSFL